MQILSIELENVKSFARAKVDFAPGVNAIVGHNGAGKSTILEAIGFVLFDSLEYTQAAFIRAGANYAAATVTFVSSADERAYSVVRRIGSSAAYYVYDPELAARLCDGKADVARFLCQHLGLEAGVSLPALFKDAVGVPQGTLTAAFLLTPKDRKGIFDALLRVDEYEKVWERLREPLSLLDKRQNEVAVEIKGLETALSRVPDLQSQVAEATARLAQAEEGLRKATAALAAVQTRRSALETVQLEVLAAERALAQANPQLQGSRARLLAAEQALADAQAARQVVDANREGYERYVAAQARQATLDAQVKQRQQVEARRAAADRELALLRADVARLTADLAQAQKAAATAAGLADSVAKQEQLEAALAAAQQQQARWEEAQRRVTEQQALVTRLTQRLAALRGQVARGREIEAAVQKLEAAIADAEAAMRRKREEMAGFKTRAELLKEQSATLADVRTAVCPVCEQPLTAAHRQQLMARNESQLQAMRADYRALQLAVEEAERANQQHQSQLRELQAELRTLARSHELETVTAELAAGQEALDAAAAQARELATAAEQVATLRRELDALGDPRRRYHLAADQAARQTALAAQLAQTEQQVRQLEATVARVTAELAQFAMLDAHLAEVAATLAQASAAYQAVLANRRQAEELSQRQAVAQEAAQEAATLAARVAQLEAAHRAAAARFDATEFAALTAQEQALRQAIGGLQAQVDHARREQARLARELADLETTAVTLAAAQERRARLEWEKAALGHLRELIRQAGPYISQTLSRQVSEGARQIFSDLMQDYSRHLSWNQDYGITLEVDGHERHFGQLSGGEQMSAALSVRLALLREMSSIDVAFFDEPTANLDEARREALARQIFQVRGFRQIFVISHDDTFEQATQNLVRVQRLDGTSYVTYG